MNNPVLLPKRKEFGFLKPPSASSQLSNVTKRINTYNVNKTNRSDLTGKSESTIISHFGNPMAKSLSSPDLPHYNKASNNGFNYSFDPLKLRYEIKDHSIGKSPLAKNKSNEINVNIVSNSKENLMTSNALVSSFSKKKPSSSGSRKREKKNFNELREAHFERQAYTSHQGTNVKNQSKQHQFLTIPYKRAHHNASIQSNYDLIGPEITGSDTGFAASRLVVKREKTSITNCSKCGKLYYDYKCLNCEFGKKKFQFNWRPQNLKTKEMIKNRFAGYTSVSSFSGIDSHSNGLNRPALARTAVSEKFALSDKNITKPLTAVTNKSNLSNNLVINKILNENKKFSEFDMSFKYDFSSNTINDQKSQKSAKSEREANEQAKLTLYLI